ncbi:MAG: phasin family protein [Alphaproteobacteria bacterium]|nr:phasin family protein [Alphaproteobacteria bacterium]
MAKQSNQFAGAFPAFQMPDFSQFTNMGTPGLDSFMQSSNAMMKAVGELNAEILGFTKQRLDAGIAVSQTLAQCKSMQAAVEVQMDFARTEAQVYLDEARKIMELASHAATEGLKPMQEMHKNGTNGHAPHARANGKR